MRWTDAKRDAERAFGLCVAAGERKARHHYSILSLVFVYYTESLKFTILIEAISVIFYKIIEICSRNFKNWRL